MQPQKPRQFADITPPKSNVIRPTNLNSLPPAQPTVTKIPVQNFAPPPQVNDKIFTPLTQIQPQAPPTPTMEPQNFTPPAPAIPPAEVPKFGALQSKIDSHPLFSGATERSPKKPGGLFSKLLWILAILLVIGATIYVVIDSGAVNTNINLPFHIFKQPIAVTSVIETNTNTSDSAAYEDTAKKFIAAINTTDKKTADNLQTAAFNTANNKLSGSSSFYDSCVKAGELCTAFFKDSFLKTATKSISSYISSSGETGKTVKYTVKQNSTSSSSNSASTSTVTISVIKNGTVYLVDTCDINVDASANANLQAQ